MTQLKKTLGPWMLWGLGVGYVISGMYFGWNLGLPRGGTLGLAVATGFITLMYVTFVFSYTELACAIPRAGGAFAYAERGLGGRWGFLAGMAQNVEFVFAPPAIAFAIGAYFLQFFGETGALSADMIKLLVAIAAFALFTYINIRGVRTAAILELLVTLIAVAELLIFAGATLPEFKFSNLQQNALPNGWMGAFAAIPFAIWFYLAIEGVANVAEETENPQRNVSKGFGFAILTLVILCALTFTSSVGVGGWESIVYPADAPVVDALGTPASSDAPLPLALEQVVGADSFLYRLLIGVGLFGLIASFHGIILAAGRATFEFGRAGLLPRWVGTVSSKTQTPANALILNALVGVIALFTGRTDEIITIAVFGALTLYIISMISLFALRRNAPELERPYRVPLYPVFPAVALFIACVALVAVAIFNPWEGLIYLGILGLAYVYYLFVGRARREEVLKEEGF